MYLRPSLPSIRCLRDCLHRRPSASASVNRGYSYAGEDAFEIAFEIAEETSNSCTIPFERVLACAAFGCGHAQTTFKLCLSKSAPAAKHMYEQSLPSAELALVGHALPE